MLKDRLNKHFDSVDFKCAALGPAAVYNCNEFVIVSDDGKYSRIAILESVITTKSFIDDEQRSYRVRSIDSPDSSVTYKYADAIDIPSLPRVISKRFGDCYLLGLANENTAVVTPLREERGTHFHVPMTSIAWPDNIKWGLDYKEPCKVTTDELPNRCREEGV